METQDIILERIRVIVTTMANEEGLQYPKFDVERSLTDTFKMHLHGYLWGESLPSVYYEWPDGAWQAFKHRWFPAWLLKWIPVQFITLSIEGKVIYPDLKVQMPEKEWRLRIQHYESTRLEPEKVNKQDD